jgi:conjugal transfer pilus assembly protein TraA
MNATLSKPMLTTRRLGFIAAAAVAAMALPALVEAGTGGTEFNALYTLVEGWMKGTLGKLAAVSMAAVGIFAGMLRGNLLGGLTGIGAGVLMFFLPDIIGGIVTATLDAEAVAAAGKAALPAPSF